MMLSIHIILPDGKVLVGYGNVKLIMAHYLMNEPIIFHKDVDSI